MPRPFEPVGDVARWRLVFDLLVATLAESGVDFVVTYKDMAEALDLDPDVDRRTIQGVMPRAAKEFLEVHKHAMKAVPNQGYRIVKPAEHLGLAQERSSRATRHMVKADSVVTNVDFNGMESEVRRSFEVIGRVVRFQMGMMRQLDIRQRDVDERLAAVQANVQRTERDVQTHSERLAWLEEQERRRMGGDAQTA